MRIRKIATALAAALALFALPACAPQQQAPAPAQEEVKPTLEVLAARAYNEVLNKIESYDFQPYQIKSFNSYDYALVTVEDRTTPLMLVKIQDPMVESIRVFAYNESTGAIDAPDEVIPVGVASVGGFRGGVSLTAEQPHLEYTTLSSGTGAMEIEKIAVAEGKITHEKLWEGRIDAYQESSFKNQKTTEIKWVSALDRKPLEEYSGEHFEAPELDPAEAKAREKLQAGMLVLKGTIKQFNRQELLAFQNMKDPNPGTADNSTYTVLVLPAEQSAKLPNSGGGSYDTIFKMVCLLDFQGTVPEGEVYVSLDPQKTWTPSDTSLPLGEPRSSSYEILH